MRGGEKGRLTGFTEFTRYDSGCEGEDLTWLQAPNDQRKAFEDLCRTFMPQISFILSKFLCFDKSQPRALQLASTYRMEFKSLLFGLYSRNLRLTWTEGPKFNNDPLSMPVAFR